MQLFAIQATEYGLLAILMALISNPNDHFLFNDLAVRHMQVCLKDSAALDGLLGHENRTHPKGSAVLQVFLFYLRFFMTISHDEFSLGHSVHFPTCLLMPALAFVSTLSSMTL